MSTQPRTRSRPVAKVVKSLLGVLALIGTVAVVGAGQVASAGGNQGRVEIDNATGTPGSNNNPHQVCGIRVEFYNFASDTHTATVSFSGQGASGTSVAGVLAGSAAQSFTFAGAGGNNQTPDIAKVYFIDTTGLVPTNAIQGYHIDVDTNVDGRTAKQKVIFVHSCSQPPTTVTPIAPTVAQSVCVGTTPSTPTYTINGVTGVVYSVDRTHVTGINNATPGSTVIVDVDALKGYQLAANAPKSFRLVFDPAPNCALPPVTPVAPTVAQSVCVGTTPSTPTYFIPTVAGVVYSESAGSHNAAPGSTVTITAAADSTHRLAADAQRTFPLTFNAAPNCSNIIVIPTAPDLSIVKAGPSSAVLPGAQVPYTLTVRNNGTAAATNVKVTDDLAAGLTLVSATGTNWVCASGSKVVCDLTGSLAVGASTVINVVTTLSATYNAATVVNTAVVTPTDATPADNSSTATTPVVGNLAISKTGTGSLFPGDELVWTLTVTNTRGTPATGFTVTDTLPAGTSYSSAAGTDFVCTNVGQDVSCVYGASLTTGSSAQIVVRALLSGTYTGTTVSNTAVIDPKRPDSNPADNTSTFVSTVTFTGGGGGVVVPTPSPSVSPSVAPAVSPAPVPTGGGGGALPFTGLPTDQLLLGGVLFLLAGLLLTLGVRRRVER